MPKFTAIIYAVVNVKVPGIEAATAQEAALKAEDVLDEAGCPLNELIDRTFRLGTRATDMSYSEAIDSYKVDLLDDKDEVVDGASVDLCADGATAYEPARAAMRELLAEFAKTNPGKAKLAAAFVNF